MIIGVPKERKDQETRVAITPSGVEALVNSGHCVLIERDAGALSAFSDEEYSGMGATIVADAASVWARSQVILKVKEPIDLEYEFFRPGLTIFTYLHLAALPELTQRLLSDRVTGIAYETVTGVGDSLPLLTPMSEVAGRMSVQVGAAYLEKSKHGRGVLLGGVPGVAPASVCILGGGIVGTNAAKIALGLGADVTIVDRNLNRLRELDDTFNGRAKTLASNAYNIARAVESASLVIGGVLIPGDAAPKILTAKMVKMMKRGSVIVDVAIDQGGCIETARPTSHSNPSYEVDGVIHYCVTNMPAAVPNTSTLALTNATFPFVALLAKLGVESAIKSNANFAHGLNTYQGNLTCAGVAKAQGQAWRTPLELMA
jgi:alanine dehydrogenase